MKLPPVISVVGKSGVGKTVFLEKLIAELKGRGIRVGTVKHDVHGFEIDQPGKDSWRHAQAGSDAVVIASSRRVALIKRLDEEMPLDEIVRAYLGDMDLVITEGYKSGRKKKIEISRRERSQELVSPVDDLMAIVADQAFDLEVPQFGLEDVGGVADLILERFLT
ncbi:MAG: molybdopterin-guanine dinucleotide biosynthesis protein B [Anaerolineae bacterium]|nr:molybdopterin-guanine dinucleotide biosynthesis protein B [Anaerolineae bacterium]NIN97769.1 molybdopterin-guanine dinucleotide biosynthesis protein B [Anaerolineae bacterium]NIQ80765.1 molybdopterin-guanine dinucleotide biosynthesis protein B [Anaerolineae bacterium]